MKFKPASWYPISTVLSVINVVSVWFAAVPGEAMHATVHAALGVAFGAWAIRLRQQRPGGGSLQERLEEVEVFRALEGEVGMLREALAESQARVQLSERLRAEREAQGVRVVGTPGA